jgi:hypothetical protein
VPARPSLFDDDEETWACLYSIDDVIDDDCDATPKAAGNGGDLGAIAAQQPSPQGGPAPSPDRGQLEMFVRALFTYATPGFWISLRAFYEKGVGRPPFRKTPVQLAGDPKGVIDLIYREVELAARAPQAVVFCPPIATFTNDEHAREEDLAEGLALSVECDAHARAARAKLEELFGPATAVVASGGVWTNPETGETEAKLHLHYRLKLPARSKDEQKKLKLARKLAAKLVGGDPSNVPLVHPIRWPGSVHRKSEPKLCRIITQKSISIWRWRSCRKRLGTRSQPVGLVRSQQHSSSSVFPTISPQASLTINHCGRLRRSRRAAAGCARSTTPAARMNRRYCGGMRCGSACSWKTASA